MGPILEAVRTRNSEQAQDWAHSEHWATVEQLIAASQLLSPQSGPQSVAFAGMGALGGGVELGQIVVKVGWLEEMTTQSHARQALAHCGPVHTARTLIHQSLSAARCVAFQDRFCHLKVLLHW
jgi:hypothetical protein